MNRAIKICLMLVMIVITALVQVEDVSANNKGDNILKHADVINKNKYIDSKYAITPKFIDGYSSFRIDSGGAGVTKLPKYGGYVIVEPKNEYKNKIKATYKKIATYKGRELDLEFTVSGWGTKRFNGGQHFVFYYNRIGLSQAGYDYITLKGTYKYNDTGKEATDLPGSYMNVIDLDVNQFMRFTPAQYKRIDKMYAYNNPKSTVRLWKTGSNTNIGARHYNNYGLADKRGHVLFLVDGHKFDFSWSRDWSRPSQGNVMPYLDRVLKWKNLEMGQLFEYTHEKPMATKPEKPTKRIHVTGKDVTSNSLSSLSDTINYRVYHNVPAESKAFYYKNYTFTDQLDKALDVDVSKVRVYKITKGNTTNVTRQFTKSINKDNLLTVKAKNSKRAAFHDSYYRIDIPAKLNTDGKHLGNLKKNGTQVIKNKAKVNIESVTKADYHTNEVTTTINAPKVQAPVKTVSDSNVTDVKSNTLSPLGDTVTYKVTHNVASDFKHLKFSEYKFEDKIDEAWDIISAKVINGNNNRETKKFDIDITNNKVTATAKKNELNDNGFYGKDYILDIKVKAKDPEDLIWITKGEPTYQLTNKASVTINDETKDSNVVTTTIEYNPEDLYKTRCEISKDEVIGVTKNDVTVTKGFLPSGSGEFEPKYSEYKNEAYNMIYNESQRPQVGWSEAQWNNWKDKFQNGSLKTNDVNLSNLKDILQKNGGVLNVTRTHYESKMSVELCQEQVRTPNFETQEWEWHDKGGKKIHEDEDGEPAINYEYNISYDNDSYQILGVNCNVDGVNSVIEDFKADYEIDGYSYDTGSRASRLLVVRPKKPGTPFPLGEGSHYTGKDHFYKPDGIVRDGKRWENSCQADLSKACKSTPLSGSEVKNDSNKNDNNKTFSMVENPGKANEEYHFPGDKNQIMFFRDNEDRQVRADVWYLDKNDKTYSSNKNAAAKQTDLRVLSGTPEIDITTISPWDTEDSISEFGKESTYEDQHINRINVKSRWASKTNEPYKIGMAWTYEASAKNSGVVEIDGYKINKLETNEHKFDAICSFQKKPGSYQAVIPRNLFVNGKIDSNDKWKFSDTMEIMFTRSISDRVTGK